jgi:hypothetical protein
MAHKIIKKSEKDTHDTEREMCPWAISKVFW